MVDVELLANGMEFVRTTDGQCDYLRYQDCDAVEADVLTGGSVTDGTLALGGHAYYALKNGDDISALTIGTDKFLDRDGAEALVFNNKLWLIGGSQSGYKSDIWSSTDGANWKKELAQAAFSARKYHRIALFNNQLWLIGGLTDNGRANDIWSSTDGINWVLRSQHAAFSARYEHTVFAFLGKLWLVGGEAGDTLSDIWSSSDGITWNKEVDAAPFGARSGMQITSYNNQLFLTGGFTTSAKNDVWTSTDGVNWSLVVEHAAFTSRDGHAIHQFGGKLWLTGGYVSGVGALKDIWFSSDGLSWELASSVLPETQLEHKILPLKGELFMLGGFLRDKVWATSNGVDWANSTRANIPDACRYFELAGQLYATDGADVLWQANDLLDWSRLSINSPVPAQSLCDLVVHNGALYVVGGFAGTGQYRNDIWSSPDGKNWTQIASSTAFSPRTSQALVSFNGKLWAAGGNNFSQSFDEIWSSVDGTEWVKTGNFDLPTGGLIYKQLFVFKNRLWFIVNYGTIWDATRTLKAYSTDDGLVWQAEALNNLTIKNDFLVAVSDETLVLFNSDRADRSQWSSADGNNWSLESNQVPFLATDSFTWNNKLMAMGNPVSAGGAAIDYSKQLWAPDTSLNWRRAYSGQFVFNSNE
ncbi:Kelch repeat-containing protein [Cellvibrio fontiphilus]|uniref:DUF6242 domain-containing protein n=1 Tax=Cellvibrio fontiphilus TaxID=1815559 RepID=A0ABV7FDX5_9GAMM